MKVAKRFITVILLLALIGGVIFVYLKQFSSSPQKTVEHFFDAYNTSDINGMVACMEPQTEQLLQGSTGIASALFGAITGVDLDFGDLIDLMPLFANTSFDSSEEIFITDIQIISYTPIADSEIIPLLIHYMPDLVNVLAKDAVVEFRIEGTDVTAQLEVVFYGNDGWRIPLDADLFSQ